MRQAPTFDSQALPPASFGRSLKTPAESVQDCDRSRQIEPPRDTIRWHQRWHGGEYRSRLMVLVALLLFGAGAAVAQVITGPSFHDYEDELLAPSPCGSTPTIAVAPFVTPDSRVRFLYRCQDGRDYVRAFGGYVAVVDDFPQPPCTTPQPAAGWTCVNGGWIPPSR